MQFFKGDALELKFYNAAAALLSALSASKDEFFSGAYDASPLGEMLYDNRWAPLANAIDRDIYRFSFNEIFTQFRFGGNFESYLNIFRKIFGNHVDVQFTVTAPGKLQIDIVVAGFDYDQIELVGGTYDGDTLITQTGSFDLVTKNRRDIDLITCVVRKIIDNAYTYYDLVDQQGNAIGFQTLKGFNSQYEIEQMLFEMVPAGVFTTINLTLS